MTGGMVRAKRGSGTHHSHTKDAEQEMFECSAYFRLLV